MQRALVQGEGSPSRILYVGELAGPTDLVHAATLADALVRLRQQRFNVLILDLNVGSDSDDVKRLARLDPEMYLFIAAREKDLSEVGLFARECEADGVVQLPLNREEISSAVVRASRLGSRVAHCVKLYESCRSLLGTLKQRDLVRSVLDIAPRVVAANNVALFLVGAFCESRGAFECHASESPVPELRGLLAEVTGLVSKRGAVMSDDDVTEGRAASSGWRWLGCPLFGADALGGAIVFLRSAEADPFSPLERQAASTFAATVASALENSRDYRELESKVKKLTRERQRAVAREAITIARNLGGAVAHEVTSAMTAVVSNVDALAAAAQDQELWKVAKEAAEYLILQGEPTGQRLASRIMDAGGTRNTDGLVTEIAGMIDECLEGVRRVSELARGLSASANANQLPPPVGRAPFDASELFRAQVVTQAVVNRPVLFRGRSPQPLFAAKSDVEQAIAYMLRALDAEVLGSLRSPNAGDILLGSASQEVFAACATFGSACLVSHEANAARSVDSVVPLVLTIEECDNACTLTIDDPLPLAKGPDLQSLLAPRLRLESGNVCRFDASFSLAHALLARNGLDLWVEPRAGGGARFMISSNPSAA